MGHFVAVSVCVLLLTIPSFSAPASLLRPPACSVVVPKLPVPIETLTTTPAPGDGIVTLAPGDELVSPAPEGKIVVPAGGSVTIPSDGGSVSVSTGGGTITIPPGDGALSFQFGDTTVSQSATGATVTVTVSPGGNLVTILKGSSRSVFSTGIAQGAEFLDIEIKRASSSAAAKSPAPLDDRVVILMLDPQQAFGDPVPMSISRANYNRLVDIRNSYCTDGMSGVYAYIRDLGATPQTTPIPPTEPETDPTTTTPLPVEDESSLTTIVPSVEPELPPTMILPLPGDTLPPTTVPTLLEEEVTEPLPNVPEASVRDPGSELGRIMAEENGLVTVDSTLFSTFLSNSRLFEKTAYDGVTQLVLRNL